jgi:exodeoxyribonuclease-3
MTITKNQNTNTLKLVSWNVNGLRAISKKGFHDFIGKSDFDIVCLQEIKVHKDKIPDELKSFGGYLSYFSCAQKPGYSGVAIYSKIKPLRFGQGFGISRFDDEGRVIWLDFKDFILFNTYMPNGGRDKKGFPLLYFQMSWALTTARSCLNWHSRALYNIFLIIWDKH